VLIKLVFVFQVELADESKECHDCFAIMCVGIFGLILQQINQEQQVQQEKAKKEMLAQ
jgi:hypothetical protein